MKSIKRYNHRRKLQEESVAEHTCFVSLFCLRVMESLDLTTEERLAVMECSALHDVGESMTSDIPHDVKARYQRVREVLEEVEQDYIKTHWSFYEKSIDNLSSLCYNIIKVSDAYSVLQYCMNELELGNSSAVILEIKTDAEHRITEYTAQINAEMKTRKDVRECQPTIN